MKINKTAILGAGGWGTALAWLLGKNDREVWLCGHNADRVQRLRATRENADYLPGVKLSESVHVTAELSDCEDADLVIFVTPSVALREIAQRLRAQSPNERAILLSGTKGIEHGSGQRMSEILKDAFPNNTVAVLSGPNLAAEIVRDLPTATVLGCSDIGCATHLQKYLGGPRFRIYTSAEVAGIELGGALKNVFALAAGVSDGLGLGDNSKAALVTRSLAEMVRIGAAMGGKATTFYGLSGAGDLMATCFSPHSRNRRVGEELGSGKSLSDIVSSMQMVAEGVPTARSVYERARKLNIETPVIDQVYAMIYDEKTAAQALSELLQRDQKSEMA